LPTFGPSFRSSFAAFVALPALVLSALRPGAGGFTGLHSTSRLLSSLLRWVSISPDFGDWDVLAFWISGILETGLFGKLVISAELG
jgi:hypothetical protein